MRRPWHSRVSGGAVAEAGAVPSDAKRREEAETVACGRSVGIAYPERREAERGSSVAARQRRA